jgi:hypothetical protein
VFDGSAFPDSVAVDAADSVYVSETVVNSSEQQKSAC